MMRSLYSGVAGLKTHQTKMDVIGNNIANVNTTSFKSQSITFSDLMYQTTQTASGATETKGGVNARQIGLGAKSGAINTAITAQGATQTTNNPFDIMITGESFFVVSDGSKRLYTRDGSFYVDGAGNLAMQSNGYLVQGWAAVEDRETGEIQVNKNGELTSLQLMSAANYTYAPASTTAALFSGNIDAADTNVTSVDGKTITLEFYDNKGYLYTGKFTLKNTDNIGSSATNAPENCMYALTLTDIIDSNGKSINENKDNYDLLSQITFGDVDSEKRSSSPIATQPTYNAVPGTDSTTISINKDGGDVKYSSVSASGNLVDLMSPTESKNAKLANLLKDAYGLSDNDIKSLYPGYLTAQYSIDNNGKLTISSVIKNIPGLGTNDSASYDAGKYAAPSFTKTNDKNYFIDSATQKAYRVPGQSGTASELSADMLKDVFGITAPYGADYNYNYENGTLKIYNNVSITSNTGTVDQINSQLSGFKDSTGNSLETALNSYTANLNTLKYNYSNGELTITQPVTHSEDTSVKFDVDLSAVETGINELASNQTLNWNTNAATSLTYSEINAIATDDGSHYSANEISAAQAICAQLDTLYDNASTSLPGLVDGTPKNNITVLITSATGTQGFVVGYPKSVTEYKPFPDANALSSTPFSNAPVVTKSYRDNMKANSTDPVYSIDKPAYVFQNNSTYGTSYYVTGDKLTKNITSATINADFLKAVYPASAADINALLDEMRANATREYTLSINDSGYLKITHLEDGTPIDPVDDYQVEKDGEDGTFKFSTNQAYVDIPKTGNISDLLTGAKGNYANVLEKVYGITDEMADAFGLDGTYTIDNTQGSNTYGQITLKTGKHTIQLKFNPDDGSIYSADTDTLSKKVNLTFGQDYAGLEAFGFQASPNNAAEQDRAYTISIDFSTLNNRNTNGSSTIKATKGDIASLNTGRAVGEMNGISVSTNGSIFATYSNGQTKLLGQIASAEFANASGLSKEGDNLYSSTLNSGEATIQDITTDGGYMNTGVLEMSNVDLSSQFTEMITTQRGFQANSRIITVSDTLLEELTNLKR